MPSEILVHLDTGPHSIPRAKAALALAAAQGAVARGLVIAATPSAPYLADGGMTEAATIQAIEELVAAQAQRATQRAEGELGLQTILVSTRTDRILVDCASVMRAADFTIIAPPEYDEKTLDEDVFEAALFMSGRPALVMSRTAEARAIGHNIVIAWKDCREAARAIHDAMPLLKAATSVRLIAVKGEDDPRYFGQAAMERMVQHLRACGVPAHPHVITAGPKGAAPSLLGEAADSDLIVMGGYGHWRLSEWLFGGMTQYMLKNAAIPLFLSR
jgi:nucleotide-binding universal stress UspA family protein